MYKNTFQTIDGLKALKLLGFKPTLTGKYIHFPCLEYHDFLKNEGISPELCQAYGIGYCKKGIMNGHIAITVHDENGMKIAYVGINPKTRCLTIPKTFNSELYLYNYYRANLETAVYFTTHLLGCPKIIQNGNQAPYNFGPPYLSSEQLKLVQDFKLVSFSLELDYLKEIAYQFATNLVNFHRFVKEFKDALKAFGNIAKGFFMW